MEIHNQQLVLKFIFGPRALRRTTIENPGVPCKMLDLDVFCPDLTILGR